MAALVLGDHRVGLGALERLTGCHALVAELGVGARVDRRAIVGIDDVAGGAAGLAIIAGMVIGADEVQGWVKQTSLCQTDENGVCPVLGAEAAQRQLGAEWPARILIRKRDAQFSTAGAAAFKDTQDVARLGVLEARQRIEEVQYRPMFHLPL